MLLVPVLVGAASLHKSLQWTAKERYRRAHAGAQVIAGLGKQDFSRLKGLSQKLYRLGASVFSSVFARYDRFPTSGEEQFEKVKVEKPPDPADLEYELLASRG